MKNVVYKARRLTEGDFDKLFLRSMRISDVVGYKDLSEWSLEEVESFISEVIFKGMVPVEFGIEMLVIRLDGNRGFVFIKSPEEFLKFVKKYYGGIEKLVERTRKVSFEGKVSKRHVLVLDEPIFKRFLRMVERHVRGGAARKMWLDDIIYKIDWVWNDVLKSYGVKDGMIFKYNKRWIEILEDGSGDYRSLVEFLEDEFGSLENWLRERVFKGYTIKFE